jgi:TolB-like protein
MSDNSFFDELRKRKVVQTAAIYGALAWGVTEVVVTVVEQLFLPQWVSTLAVIGFVVGFPVIMFLSWTFDITAEGLRRTKVASRRGTASIAVSVFLLVAGTAGLFFLIKPALQFQQIQPATVSIVPNSVAVLPFDNASQNPNDSFLSEGLSDELRDQLGRVAGIRIAARSSSVAAREQQLDALTISTRLGVAHLVEGSLRRQGNKLKVSVQLIEGSSGLALWSETFERGPNELLSVQQAIAKQVVKLILPDSNTAMAEPATGLPRFSQCWVPYMPNSRPVLPVNTTMKVM